MSVVVDVDVEDGDVGLNKDLREKRERGVFKCLDVGGDGGGVVFI